MLAEGTELLHSKRGVENTYQCGDLNALDYNRRQQYPFTFDYAKNLITLRQRTGIFKQKTISKEYAQCFESKERNSATAVLLSGLKETLLVALNPHEQPANFILENIPLDKFQQIADTFTFGDTHYTIKENQLCVPPMSCGIWIKKR